ncbi:MAG: hypothetical protein EA353_04400 [Puniceicoccaceae bacterium]|nr:MAG: hypothetical protein EA353_04400 [Puniceicoccaceae bacterium]
MDNEYESNIPPEIEDDETLTEPLSPSELLDKALNIMPGGELLPYLTTIIYLRDHKKYSWRGVATWLKENGNIETSHTTVCNFYKYVHNHPNYRHDLLEAEEELKEMLVEGYLNQHELQ